MRYVIMAAVFAATISPALAGGYEHSKNPSINIKNYNYTSQWQKQAQYQSSVNKNYNTSSSNSSSTASSSSTATASNEGVHVDGGGNSSQPGGVGIPSPSAGNCGGYSGGFAVGVASLTLGGSFGDIEKACQQDRHISIGLADPVTAPKARELWFSMNNDLFGTAAGAHAGGQTSAIKPAAISPEQTADAGSICNPSLPKVLLAQCQAKQ